jgi:hypothetical protein
MRYLDISKIKTETHLFLTQEEEEILIACIVVMIIIMMMLLMLVICIVKHAIYGYLTLVNFYSSSSQHCRHECFSMSAFTNLTE